MRSAPTPPATLGGGRSARALKMVDEEPMTEEEALRHYLTEEEREVFEAACRRGYADAYVADAMGITTLPFSRLFAVATVTT